MTEYISRAAVINITAETGAWETQSRVRELPAADVQPVRHGQWEYILNVKLKDPIKLCECNQCHNKTFGSLNYCGNCGARMDGNKMGYEYEEKYTEKDKDIADIQHAEKYRLYMLWVNN